MGSYRMNQTVQVSIDTICSGFSFVCKGLNSFHKRISCFMRKVFVPKAIFALGLFIGFMSIQIMSLCLQVAIHKTFLGTKAQAFPNSAPMLATISLAGKDLINLNDKKRRLNQQQEEISNNQIILDEIYSGTRFLANDFIASLNQQCFRDNEFFLLVKHINILEKNETSLDFNDDVYSFIFRFFNNRQILFPNLPEVVSSVLRMTKKEVEMVLGMNMNASVHGVLPFATEQHWFALAKTAAQKIVVKSEIFFLLNLLLLTKNPAVDGWLDKSLCWVNQRSARDQVFSRNTKNMPELTLDELCIMRSYIKDALVFGRWPNDQVTFAEIKKLEKRYSSRLYLPEQQEPPKNFYSSINKRVKLTQQREPLLQHNLLENQRPRESRDNF